MNTVKCKDCSQCDPITNAARKVPATHGRCIPRSTYPFQENTGQVFPPGVKRAEEGEPCKPHVVVMNAVVKSCTLVVPKGK